MQGSFFVFGLKAGDAYTLLEGCTDFFSDGCKGSHCWAFTRLDGIWGTKSTKLMKYLNMHNSKKKTLPGKWESLFLLWYDCWLLLTKPTLECLMLKVRKHYRKVWIQLHKSEPNCTYINQCQGSFIPKYNIHRFTPSSEYAPYSVIRFDN
jgi:hypothetical protein